MPLPWLQDIDPAERLPDETKWEDHDEFTLWKQCKLRGLDGGVKKERDALRILNALKNFEVKWDSFIRDQKPDEYQFPEEVIRNKAFESLIRSTEMRTLQVLQVEEREVPNGSKSEMVIEISDATVRLGDKKRCSCDLEFYIGFTTCIHILYLELHVLRCSRRLQQKSYIGRDLTEYFANAPPAFKPQKFVRAQDLHNTISDKDCQLCFKEAKVSDDITRCEVCCRVAHQQCHDIYRTRKGACEGNTGCPLCCPQCPWNPSNQELKAELVPMEVKKESGMPRDWSATADDAVLSATKQKVRRLEKKVRKIRGQLRGQRRRKPASRTMTDRQYKRLVAKTGARVGDHRNKKGTMCQTNAPKREEACVKEERPADVSREPMMPVNQTVKKEEEKCVKTEEESGPAVEIVKVEPRRKVKSEPVVISLL